jgi:hypothetical protein
MAKVKKGDKVKVGKRSCTVKSVSGGKFSVSCGPPAGKKRRGKRKGRKASGRRGLGAVRRGGGGRTCGLPAGLINMLPAGAADQLKDACLDAQGGLDVLLAKVKKGKKAGASRLDKAAMHAAHKLLNEYTNYSKGVKAQEKKVYRDEALARFYAAEAAKPKPPSGKAQPRYSKTDPRYDPGLAGVRRKRRSKRTRR